MSERRLGIVKKVTLAGMAEGWDESCYLLTSPVTLGQLKSLQELDTKDIDEAASLAYMQDFVKQHIIGGQVKVSDDEGNLSTSKAEASDVEQMSVEMVTHVFGEITNTGAALRDPKVSKTNTETSSTPTDSVEPSSPASTTATS